MRPQLGDIGVTMIEVEGAESQIASGKGSPDCEGFISIFGLRQLLCLNF